MDVREIRTSLQDEAEDGYSPDGCDISNIWLGDIQIESIVCARSSIAKVQLTL